MKERLLIASLLLTAVAGISPTLPELRELHREGDSLFLYGAVPYYVMGILLLYIVLELGDE